MVIGRKKIFNRMPLVDLDRKKVGIYFLLSESTIKFKLHGSVRLMDGKGNNYGAIVEYPSIFSKERDIAVMT